MAEVKWIKLIVTARNSKSMKQIKALPQGKEIALLFYELMQLAGEVNENGFLYFEQDIPFTEEMLAIEMGEKIEFVKYAIAALCKFKMVEVIDDVFRLTNWEKYQNIKALEDLREQNRLRVAKHREKQKELSKTNEECNVTVTLQETLPSISISNSNNIDSNINLNNYNDKFNKYGEYGWVKLKESQYDKLKADYPNIDIDNQIKLLDEYVQSNGNKNKYKDFNLVIRRSIRDGWFTKANNTYGKKTKSVPEWFDKHMEEAKKREEEERKKQESEENMLSMEELEAIFKPEKKGK